ncbi:hypothetical protein [Dictyobacter formicarum]|uniref:Uncharacterized protein n=1 Tax=Dictyobacter formicarum TaxID=2778368 RepID=A0ABQ3VJK5_9CHLR|nr:hypothetical protein [Dictyobacter formicarum]GHO85864.1 hypothetical protein KSZ_38700 [Dictyobacter formicarum]
MPLAILRQIKVRTNLEPTFHAQLMSSPLKFLQTFDLTEDEMRQIILPNFSWLVADRLAAMSIHTSH